MPDGLTVIERSGRGMAAVMARKDVAPDRVGAALGLALPDGPQWCRDGDLSALGTGPGTWLVMRENADGGFTDWVAERLAGLASVSDQSSAYVVTRLSGPGARVVLRRGAAIDFDPRVFRPGCAATTVIAHIGAIVWQVDDEPTFDLAVFRSLSGSFRHWLEITAKTVALMG